MRYNPSRCRRTSLLLASLALNLAFGAAWLYLDRKAPPTASTAVASTAPMVNVSRPDLPAIAPRASRSGPISPWARLVSTDYRRFIANLRAAGCPERTVCDIVVGDVNDLYGAGSQSAEPTPAPWENADHRRSEELVRADRESAQAARQRALVKALIGYEADNRAEEIWHEDFMTGLLLGFLPEPKASQVLAIADKYSAAAMRIKDAADGILIDEDREQLRSLFGNLVAEISRRLTPSELEELELRAQAATLAGAGTEVRWDDVQISGVELREFVRLSRSCQDAYRSRFIGFETDSPGDRALREATFEKSVAALLGPERFAAYQRAQDYNFHELFEFAREQNLPATAAVATYRLRQSAEAEAAELRQDSSLSDGELSAALAFLRATAAESASAALGGAYRDYLSGPGSWLGTLVSRTEP